MRDTTVKNNFFIFNLSSVMPTPSSLHHVNVLWRATIAELADSSKLHTHTQTQSLLFNIKENVNRVEAMHAL